FNKVYDPNFDLWVLFVLAVLGARGWLAGQLIPLSLVWYVTAIGGLAFLTFGVPDALNAWYVSHTLMFMIVWRLVVLGIVIAWGVRRLLSAEEGSASLPPAAGVLLPNTTPAAPTGGKLR